MNFNTFEGRNDHIHGDEGYRDAEAIDVIDVLFAIDAETGTADGRHHYYWCQRIAESDEMTDIIKHIVKNRHKPEFAELINLVELGIEGWLP